MKLLITGSSGFLGKYVVAAALQQGHHVRAAVRPASNVANIPWARHPHVEFVKLDLRKRSGIAEALKGIDAVVHLAASKAGDFHTQFAGTVIATENLLAAMTETGTKRLVAISTFSVYDYINMQDGAVLDEEAPVVAEPLSRDEYAQTKLLQEQLIRNFEKDQGGLVTILRPGVIYGRDNLWTARLGIPLGEKSWFRIGAYAKLPLAYVENCADAIVVAAKQEAAIGQTLNILDDHPPTQRYYAQQLVKRMDYSPRLISVNWTFMKLFGSLAWGVNQYFFQGQAKLPGILVPSRLQARFKCLKYSNQRIKQCLNWTPRYDLKTALDRSFAKDNLLMMGESEAQQVSAVIN